LLDTNFIYVYFAHQANQNFTQGCRYRTTVKNNCRENSLPQRSAYKEAYLIIIILVVSAKVSYKIATLQRQIFHSDDMTQREKKKALRKIINNIL